MDVNAYLHFGGNCEEAMEFYRSALGGELQINRFSEMPQDDSAPPVDGNLIMHASLTLADGQVVMASDAMPASGPVQFGNHSSIMVGPDSSEDAKRIFDTLAEGGTITMPFMPMFWGDEFGMLTDKFGVAWQINYHDPAND